MAKRIKEVFDGQMVAHLWANASQLSARNPQGNISFGGGDLRSYSTVIARRMVVKGTVVFLHSWGTWSVTTNKHQSWARNAARGPGRVSFFVTDTSAETYTAHTFNVTDYLDRASKAFAKAQRARANKESLTHHAIGLVESAKEYARLFNVRVVKFPTPETMAELGKQIVEREAKAKRQQTAAQRKRQREADENAKRIFAALPDLIVQWRAGWDTPYIEHDGRKEYYTDRQLTTLNGGMDLMRLSGEDVQTTQGASVPARIVRRLAPFVLSLMDECGDSVDPVYAAARFPGKTLHVGHFSINSWNSKWVRVGCHLFTRAEVAHILDALQRAEILPTTDAEDNTPAPTNNRGIPSIAIIARQQQPNSDNV